jgi:hypothetical protein
LAKEGLVVASFFLLSPEKFHYGFEYLGNENEYDLHIILALVLQILKVFLI